MLNERQRSFCFGGICTLVFAGGSSLAGIPEWQHTSLNEVVRVINPKRGVVGSGVIFEKADYTAVGGGYWLGVLTADHVVHVPAPQRPHIAIGFGDDRPGEPPGKQFKTVFVYRGAERTFSGGKRPDIAVLSVQVDQQTFDSVNPRTLKKDIVGEDLSNSTFTLMGYGISGDLVAGGYKIGEKKVDPNDPTSLITNPVHPYGNLRFSNNTIDGEKPGEGFTKGFNPNFVFEDTGPGATGKIYNYAAFSWDVDAPDKGVTGIPGEGTGLPGDSGGPLFNGVKDPQNPPSGTFHNLFNDAPETVTWFDNNIIGVFTVFQFKQPVPPAPGDPRLVNFGQYGFGVAMIPEYAQWANEEFLMVPEPGTISLVVFATLVAKRRRRRQ